MIELATGLSFALLGLAMLFALIRLLRGPTLADRILGLDTMTVLGVGIIATYAARSQLTLYIDIAIGLALISFLSTASLIRYLLSSSRAK